MHPRHWNELVAKLGGDDEASKSMGSLLSALGGCFATLDDINKVNSIQTCLHIVSAMYGHEPGIHVVSARLHGG